MESTNRRRTHEEPIVREMLKIAAKVEEEDREIYRALARKAHRARDQRKLFELADEKKYRRRTLKHLYFHLFRRDLPHARRPFPPLKGGFKENIAKAIVGEKEQRGYYEEIAAKMKDEAGVAAVKSLAQEADHCLKTLETILNNGK